MEHSKLPHIARCDKSNFLFDEKGHTVGMIVEEYRPAVILACNHFDEMKAELMRLRNEFKFVGDHKRANRINKIMDKLEVGDE